MVIKDPYITFRGRSIYLIFQGAKPTISNLFGSIPTVSNLIPDLKVHYEIYSLRSGNRGKSWSKMTRLKK